jgi:hypothetical protein
VISKVEPNKILSTDVGQHNWPKLEPDITECLENVLGAVRVKVGRPIEPGTVTLSVSISRGKKRDWPDPPKRRAGK